MKIFLYDGTFKGFLTAVFFSYERKLYPDKLMSDVNFQTDAFAETHIISAVDDKANRVWKAIRAKVSPKGAKKIYRTFLSEYPDVEMVILRYLYLILDNPVNVEFDFSNPVVAEFDKIHGRIMKEAHRLSMFTRFQCTDDDLYFAGFEPDFNVLPLVTVHFKDRFSDQRWVIYDLKRNYGFYYNLHDVVEIRLTNANINHDTGRISEKIMRKDEKFIQKLWGNYYQSANIRERNNPRQHNQMMPKKYWKYLPEKDFIMNPK